MSSIRASPDSVPSTKLPLKCHQWMNDLWKDLNAKSEACDTESNATHAKILGKKTGRIQSKLRAKLSEKTCTLTALLENRPAMNRRAGAYKDRAMRARKDALATISENHKVNPGLPKMPRLSEKTKLASWVDKSIRTYGKYIGSELVDESIKPRLRRIRQTLWFYRKTGKGVGMVIADGHTPSRSDLECLNTEVAVMLTITSKIRKYSNILDESLVDTRFQARVAEIIRLLKSYQENNFRVGYEMDIIKHWEEQIQAHLETRSPGTSSLAEESEL